MKTFQQFLREAANSEDDERQAYFNRVYDAAARRGDKFPEVVAAQAALESGFGKYLSGKNNHFGQKAGDNEPGTVLRTREVVNGQDVYINARFRDFDSDDEGVQNRIKSWSDRYADLDPKKDSIETAASRLVTPPGQEIGKTGKISDGVYATDPQYVSSVSSLARQYRDRAAAARAQSAATPTPTPTPTSTSTSSSETVKKVISDTGGKGGKVTTNTAYASKLGGVKATSTRDESGNQVIRANLGKQDKVDPKQIGKSFAATLGGQKGTVTIGSDGQKTFSTVKKAK